MPVVDPDAQWFAAPVLADGIGIVVAVGQEECEAVSADRAGDAVAPPGDDW